MARVNIGYVYGNGVAYAVASVNAYSSRTNNTVRYWGDCTIYYDSVQPRDWYLWYINAHSTNWNWSISNSIIKDHSVEYNPRGSFSWDYTVNKNSGSEQIIMSDWWNDSGYDYLGTAGNKPCLIATMGTPTPDAPSNASNAHITTQGFNGGYLEISKNVNVAWNAASRGTNTSGIQVSYRVEVKLGNNGWTFIGDTTGTSYNYTIPANTPDTPSPSLQFRIRPWILVNGEYYFSSDFTYSDVRYCAIQESSGPQNVVVTYGNPEPITTSTWNISWLAPLNPGTGDVVTKYLLKFYKNNLNTQIGSTIEIPYTGNSQNYDFTLPASFVPGDLLYITLQAVTQVGSRDINGQRYIHLPAILLVSDKYIYISQNGDTFTKRKMYISQNGGNFIEVKKEKFKVI